MGWLRTGSQLGSELELCGEGSGPRLRWSKGEALQVALNLPVRVIMMKAE